MKKYKVRMKKDDSGNYRWFYVCDNPERKGIDKMLATFDADRAGVYRGEKAKRIKTHFTSKYPHAVVEIY